VLNVALTGGIGSGKSRVGQFFSQLGATVVDFDQLARIVVERGSAGFEEIVARFGDEILKNGELDREKLGAIVFSDPSAKRELESITHPKIRQKFNQITSQLASEEILIAEIPLLVESKERYSFDRVITVSASADLRRARLESRGLTGYQISERMAAQATDAQREAIADYVIVNEGSLDDLLRSVEELYNNRLYPFRSGL
jgi:dephospho-CoA kinase